MEHDASDVAAAEPDEAAAAAEEEVGCLQKSHALHLHHGQWSLSYSALHQDPQIAMSES